MREIKFRAWDTKFHVMIPQVAVFDNENIVIVDVLINEIYDESIFDDRLDTLWDGGPEHYLMTGGFKLMQYINKNDRNGAEVYDGDEILIYWKSCEPTSEIISYDEKYGYWKYGNNPICELMENDTTFEVIGNIYQKPVLINESIS